MKKALVILVALVLAAFGVAACGGDDDDAVVDEPPVEVEPPTDSETVTLTSPADGSFAYDQESVTAPAGPVEIEYTNPATLSHDAVLEDADGNELGRTELISGGETDSFTVDLQPGTYTYYCEVPGHRDGGMEGTLTVE